MFACSVYDGVNMKWSVLTEEKHTLQLWHNPRACKRRAQEHGRAFPYVQATQLALRKDLRAISTANYVCFIFELTLWQQTIQAIGEVVISGINEAKELRVNFQPFG